MKILVLAAHPDDEILGVGGTICKHVADGDNVYVCMVTKACEPQWSEEYMRIKVEEQKRVDEITGVKRRFNLDLLTGRLNMIPHGQLNISINEVVDIVEPNIVYTHFENDLHYDHSLIFRGAMVATRPPKRIKVLSYETPSESEWNNKPFLPNVWVDISEFIEKKIRAFRQYKSEVKPYPHPRSEEGIRIVAKKRGAEVCREYAEAFILIRDVR